MISGEVVPTEGLVTICGINVRARPAAARQLIGYCPQFDALFELLNARDHLRLYARIKGVPEDRLDE